MTQSSFHLIRFATLGLAALLAPALRAQATPTCNGLPATIIATAPGQIMGTQGDDVIVGTAGDDQIFGLGGNDTICGGGGNDQITGGQGQDQLFGQGGNDTFIWSPGDSNDRVEGGSGSDTLQFLGANVSENLDLSADGNRLRLTRNVANIVLDVAQVERVELEPRGGTDLIVVNHLAGTGVQEVKLDMEGVSGSNTPDGQADSIIVFGAAGDDKITVAGSGNSLNITGAGPVIEIRNSEGALDSLSVYGVAGDDKITAQGLAAGLVSLIIEGGLNNDTITGSQGADTLVGGDGDDTFVWMLGSPADRVSGEAGTDTLQVVGSDAADNVFLSAGTLEVQVFNVPDGVSLLANVENVAVQPGRGADQITVNAMAGATLQRVTLDLRPTPTATAGDGYADSLVVNGTTSVDNINITGSAGSLTMSGLTPSIVVQGSEPSRDVLTVNAGFEADVVNAQGLAANVIGLVIRGGPGNDMLTGSLGDDVFTWAPGDGSDVIEGGAGNDTLQFSGSNIGEKISLTANGPRLRFTRDVAAIVLDFDAVERVTFAAQGGADTISFGDLAGTSVRQVAIDLASNGVGDGQPDTLQISALTASPISTMIGAGTMKITWSPVTISVTGAEPANDRLVLETPTGASPAVISGLAEPETTGAIETGSGVRP